MMISFSKPYLITLFFLFITFNPGLLYSQTEPPSQDAQNRAMTFFMEGLNFFENQEYERALDNLIAAHLILSDDPGLNYALSDVYFAMQDVSNALYYGEIASKFDPENRWYKIHLATIHRASGRSQYAIDIIEELLSEGSFDPDLLYQLSEIYIETGNLTSSNAALDQIIANMGGSFELHLRKFQNYTLLNEKENALRELQSMRITSPGNIGTLQLIAQFYMELDEMELAVDLLEEAAERRAGDIRTQLLLAEIFISSEEWERLGDTIIHLLSDSMIPPTEKLELVRFMASQNNRGELGELFEEQTSRIVTAFSQEEPDFMPAQLLAADYYLMREEFDQAVKILQQITLLEPENEDAWTQRIQLHFSMEEFEEVIELTRAALESIDGNSFILFFSGAAYFLMDRYSEARERLLQSVDFPSQRTFRSIIYGTLGDVNQKLGLWDETNAAMEMALRLDRNNHTALNNFAYYLSLREERLDEALVMAEQAVAMEPHNSAYLDTIGWVHFKLGNLDQAYHYIIRSVETGEASAEVFEHLGDIYQAKGDISNAVKWWKSALEADPERSYLQERWE